MPDKGLNPKQTRFVAEYLIDLNATQAAIRAGYSAKTAEQIGSRLLRNVQVRAAVDAGIAKRAGKLEITAEKVLKDLEEVRTAALKDGQYASTVRAIELQGKHIGMFVDRREVELTDKRMVAELPPTAKDTAEWAGRHGPH